MAVEFNESEVTSTRTARPRKLSGLSQLVIKTGVVKTEAGAQLVLLIVTILCAVLALFFFMDSTDTPPQPTPAQVIL